MVESIGNHHYGHCCFRIWKRGCDGQSILRLVLCSQFILLANKEKLKSQITRIVRVWIPACFAERGIHVAAVCEKNFKLFVAGQTTEAII